MNVIVSVTSASRSRRRQGQAHLLAALRLRTQALLQNGLDDFSVTTDILGDHFVFLFAPGPGPVLLLADSVFLLVLSLSENCRALSLSIVELQPLSYRYSNFGKALIREWTLSQIL